MNMPHPFMPDLKNKTVEELLKEMNDIFTKMRMVRNPVMVEQMRMVANGYQEEFQKRMAEPMERSTRQSLRKKERNKDE